MKCRTVWFQCHDVCSHWELTLNRFFFHNKTNTWSFRFLLSSKAPNLIQTRDLGGNIYWACFPPTVWLFSVWTAQPMILKSINALMPYNLVSSLFYAKKSVTKTGCRFALSKKNGNCSLPWSFGFCFLQRLVFSLVIFFSLLHSLKVSFVGWFQMFMVDTKLQFFKVYSNSCHSGKRPCLAS